MRTSLKVSTVTVKVVRAGDVLTDTTTAISRFAPAKVNLTLNVAGSRSDGYHELDSIVVFANIGDTVGFYPGAQADVVVAGAHAKALQTQMRDLKDLSLTKAFEVFTRYHQVPTGRMSLQKELPVASGVGGGTSDAAAMLHILNKVSGRPFSHEQLEGLGKEIGADGPVCVHGTACRMTGTGDVITPLELPSDMAAVLINPGVSVLTGEVFRRLAAKPFSSAIGHDDLPGKDVLTDLRKFLSWLQTQKNDLEAPAIAHEPVIGEVLGMLRQQEDCMLARMSGSGATCFGIFRNLETAQRTREAIELAHADWWSQVCLLNSSEDIYA